MRLVLDTSVAVKWALPEPDSPKALILRDEFVAKIHELIAPDTFPLEVSQVLVRAERRGLLKPGEAKLKIADVFSTSPDLHAYLPLLARAIEIATAARIAVYDCVFVALAERENCDLVTADVKLKNALPNAPIVLLSDLP